MSENPIKTGGPTKNRRPALKGIVMLDVAMGKERVRAWPRKRGKAKTAEAKALQDSFRQASWSCKYWDPRNIMAVDQLRKGTPVLIRDLQMMMMYNRFVYFELSDGRRLVPVQARQDVSDSLDSICPLPGAMLYRDVDGWRYINPPTTNGQLLVTDANNRPEWLTQSGGVGTVNKAVVEAHDSVAQASTIDNIYLPKSGATGVSNVPGNANNMTLSWTMPAAGLVLIMVTASWTQANGRMRFNVQNSAGTVLWPLGANLNYYGEQTVEAGIFNVSFTAAIQLAAGLHDLTVQAEFAVNVGAVSWRERSIAALF